MPKTRIFCVSLPRALHPTSSTLFAALDILREVSPLVPVPGLRTAIDITSAILLRVQDVRTLGVDFDLLAESAANLMVAILSEIHEVPTSVESVELLLSTLRRINKFVEQQCTRNWWGRFVHNINLQDQFKEHMQQLDSCCNAFQITSLMRVRGLLETANVRQEAAHELLHEIKRMLDMQALMIQTQERSVSLGLNKLSTTLSTFENNIQRDRQDGCNRHEAVLQAIYNLRSGLDDGECQIFRQWDVMATRVFIPQDTKNGPVYFAKLRQNGQSVLLKRYGTGGAARQRFLHDLRHWRALCHPNLLQLLGHSVLSSENPFIIITGVGTRDVAQYVRGVSANSDPKVGFMTGLSVLQGVSAALEYLRSNCRLGKYELQDCAKVSNFLLNQERQIVLGQNIIHHVPGPDLHEELRLEQWILEQFWIIAETVIFGSTYDFTDWEVVSGKKGHPHMRALLRLAAWYADQGFTSVTLRIDDLATRLMDRQASYGSLNWTSIRDAFLETEGIKHYMFYRPPEPWNVKLYDIGFVQNGKFNCICNVAEQVHFELEYQPPLYFATVPDIPPDVTLLLDGITRYEFHKPTFCVVGKTASGRHVKKSAEPFLFLIDRAPSLVAQYRNRYSHLEVRDLIFVVGTNEFPQSAAFEWHAIDEHDLGPRRSVFFYEFPNLPNDQPWGFWSFDPTPEPVAGKLHPQATTFVNPTPPQTVMFVQLENEDCSYITEG